MVWYRLCYLEMKICQLIENHCKFSSEDFDWKGSSPPSLKLRWAKWPRQESNLDLELRKLLYYPLYDEAYLISPGTLLVKIFTAMASNITPKNLRITSIPPVPSIRSI